MRNSLFLLLLLSFICITETLAQTPAPTPAALSGIKASLAAGEVKEINAAEKKISLSTSDGTIEVIVPPTGIFKRVQPDKPSLSSAVDSSISDISQGDKILVTGAVSADKKTITAKQVILMSKSDIAKRDAGEREMWRTRGVVGRVVSVDYKTRQITVALRGGMPGASPVNVVVTPKENVQFRRYAADSGRFSDATLGSLAEIKVGDEVRALGDKSQDGLTLQAEQIISGGFRTIVGNITAVDAAKNEVAIKDISTGKNVTIALTGNTLLKKFPVEFAARMTGAQSGEAQPGGQGGNVTVRPPQADNEGRAGRAGGQGQWAGDRAGGQGQGGGRGMRGDLDSMIERLPAVTLAELKPGDAVGISGSASASADRYTAIKLLAGVEPFIAASRAAGGNRGGRGGQSPSIDIPGLDGGFGTP